MSERDPEMKCDSHRLDQNDDSSEQSESSKTKLESHERPVKMRLVLKSIRSVRVHSNLRAGSEPEIFSRSG